MKKNNVIRFSKKTKPKKKDLYPYGPSKVIHMKKKEKKPSTLMDGMVTLILFVVTIFVFTALGMLASDKIFGY